MQLTSLTSASTARPVSPSVESAWRDRGQSESAKTQASPPSVNRQPETAKATPVTQRQQQFSEDEQANNSANATAASLTEELVQQQQSTGVYTAQVRTSVPTNDASQERRKGAATERRSMPHYSLASYTGERANRVYLQHAGQQTGRMVDAMV